MPASPLPHPGDGVRTSTLVHRVAFYETDGMGIVHHANFVKYLELSRIVFMDEHDRPYREYVAEGLHFATTRVEIDYRRPLQFDDRVEIQVWIERLRGASLRMAYVLTCEDDVSAVAATEHAMVDDSGRATRIPVERRKALGAAAGRA